jgi:glycosyltransferase involved in cell wall biosynthesis
MPNTNNTSVRPSVCICGNLLGRNPGYVTTQGQILADKLAAEGYEVLSVSSTINRVLRLAEILWTIIRNRRMIDLLVIEVYSGLAFVLADCASMVGKLLKIPTVFVLHGGHLPEFVRSHRAWCVRVLKRAALMVSPSSFLANEIDPYGFQIRVIPNIVSLMPIQRAATNNSSPRLLWMRSFHPIYNPQMALDVFACVKREMPDATMVMAGVDKGLESSIKAAARNMGFQNSVSFPGFLDERSKAEYFSRADVYINTNRIDNTPVSVIEAFAMGVPVVATNVGGLSHIVTHAKNGLLVSDGNVNEMADAVRSVLSDRVLSKRISENARVVAAKFGWDSVKKCWEEAFAEVLARSPAKNKRRELLPERSAG